MNTLGFSKTITYLIQAPPYVVAYAATLLVSWSSGRRLEHCFHIVGAISASLVGAVIMISTLNVGARYFSLFLLCTGPFIGLNVRLLLTMNTKDLEDLSSHVDDRSKFLGKRPSSLGLALSVPQSSLLLIASPPCLIGLHHISFSDHRSLATRLVEAASLLGADLLSYSVF